MAHKFDPYEMIGVIIPGSILLFGATFIFSQLSDIFFSEGFSLGDLGLFLILSFVAGHLLQAVGNLLEGAVWRLYGGMPTEWLIKKPGWLVHDSQYERFREALRQDFSCEIEQMKRQAWSAIVREIYAAVKADGDSERIDAFNRTYGLLRGIASAFFVLSVASLIADWPEWQPAALTAIAALIAGYRMVRFGVRYGRELVIAYLRIRADKAS